MGWYSTGPKLKEADLDINTLLSRFTENGEPIMVICEVQPKEIGLPFTAYYAIDEVREVGARQSLFTLLPLSLVPLFLCSVSRASPSSLLPSLKTPSMAPFPFLSFFPPSGRD